MRVSVVQLVDCLGHCGADFGTGKLKNLGADLGSSIKGFKAMQDGEEEKSKEELQTKTLPDDKK